MFGLQEPQNRSMQYLRLYCGTCKTIAKHYGQLSRVYLNYDLVFMVELLQAIGPAIQWPPALQRPGNCRNVGSKAEPADPLLRYTAAVHMLLAQLSIEDDLHDRGRRKSIQQQLMNQAFQKAEADLSAMGLHTKRLIDLVAHQPQREQISPSQFNDFEAYLQHLEYNTAQITALVFEQAALLHHQETSRSLLYQLGFHFGQLIYRIDAFEDRPSDLKKGAFNPLLNWPKNQVSIDFETIITPIKEKLELLILELPLHPEQQEHFCIQLSTNLFRKKSSTTSLQPTNQNQLKRAFLPIFAVVGKSIYSWSQLLYTGSLMLSILLLLFLPFPSAKLPCIRQKIRDCKRAIMGFFILLAVLALIMLVVIIWGIILLVKGILVWGLILLLIFPVLAGVYYIYKSIKWSKMSKKERRKAKRKRKRRRRILRFLYKHRKS